VSRLTIQFQGICTQIKLPQAVGTTLHRVVMVHAEDGKDLYGHLIPPHRTFLMINGIDIRGEDTGRLQSLRHTEDGNWQLLGTRLAVQNAASRGVTYDAPTYDVPSLTLLAPDFGPLSQEVVYGTDAAGHFDVSSGTFTAETMAGGAFYTTLEVETGGDGNVVLELQDLVGGETGSLTLKSGSTIQVTNTGGRYTDTQWDFLLHYLTAQTLPPDPGVPPAMIEPAASAKMWEPLGPGCSNSNYP